MGTFPVVGALGDVGPQTAIEIGARRNVGRPLALHGHLVVPADDQRYLIKSGQVAVLPRTSTRVEDQLASPSSGDAGGEPQAALATHLPNLFVLLPCAYERGSGRRRLGRNWEGGRGVS